MTNGNHECIGFGQHEDLSVESLFFRDPGYVDWMVAKGVSPGGVLARHRFRELLRRAGHLKVPCGCSCGERVERMCLTASVRGRLARVDFVRSRCALHRGPRTVVRTPGFMGSTTFHPYDKAAGRILVGAIKCAYFGDSSERMTQRKLERFFDDAGSFEPRFPESSP